MKTKLLIVVLAAVVVAGCKSTTFSVTDPKGFKVEATDRRAVMNTNARVSGVYDNGKWTITADATSSPSAALVESAVNAAVKAALGK